MRQYCRQFNLAVIFGYLGLRYGVLVDFWPKCSRSDNQSEMEKGILSNNQRILEKER